MSRRDETKVTDHRVATGAVGKDDLACTVFVGGHSFVIQLPFGGAVTFGRGPDSDVQLVSGGVSRAHAHLDVRGDHGVVSDLGSRNGTLVNGKTIAGPTRVAHGDEVAIGDARLAIFRRSTLPAGTRSVLVHRAFLDALEAHLAVGIVSVVVIELPTRWYELRAVADLLARLPSTSLTGIVNDHVLAVALAGAPQAEATSLAGMLTSSLSGASVEARTAVATRASCHAKELVDAALLRLLAGDHDAPHAVRGSGGVDVPVVRDEAMRRLHDQARRVAASDISVLLVGETGVGKEVFARAIHAASGRPGRLVGVNTAALPEALIESELFGHERGAFSGATQAKVGLLETAHKGTVFLDEIGELPLPMQAKLLRVLEERSVRRVGSTVERKIDVRVIAATNANLDIAVAERRFRSDLLFRLNASTLLIPPLRERTSEIAELATGFLAREASARGLPALQLAPSVIALLERHSWPGNVRELRNVMERAAALVRSYATSDTITADHLPDALVAVVRGPGLTMPPAAPFYGSALADSSGASGPPSSGNPSSGHPSSGNPSSGHSGGAGPSSGGVAAGVRDSMKDYERQQILDALDKAGGNQTRAAELLGLPRRTLAYKMARLGIVVPR